MAFKAIDPRAKPVGDEAMSMMNDQERKDYMTQNAGGQMRMQKQMQSRPMAHEMPRMHEKHPGQMPASKIMPPVDKNPRNPVRAQRKARQHATGGMM